MKIDDCSRQNSAYGLTAVFLCQKTQKACYQDNEIEESEKYKIMKMLMKIIKIGSLSLCAVFIIMQVVILANSNRILEVASGAEADEEELPTEGIPLADFTFEDTDETTVNTTEKETETETEPESISETETETEASIEIPSETEPDVEIIFETEPTTITETTAETTEDDVVNTDVQFIETTESTGVSYNGGLLPKNMPVFMYHTSSEYNPGDLTELYVKPSEFEKQVLYLIENGYTFCTFDDYYNLNSIEKPVFITFDDGYRENYTEIFPILQKYKEYNVKITIFLIINSITDTNITRDMIVEMSDSGLVKFESHTNSHPSLVAISGNETRLIEELQNSKNQIEEMTGRTVLALAYPNGEFNDIVLEKTKEFYSFGLRKDMGMHNTQYDALEVRRIRMGRSTPLSSFISYLG